MSTGIQIHGWRKRKSKSKDGFVGIRIWKDPGEISSLETNSNPRTGKKKSELERKIPEKFRIHIEYLDLWIRNFDVSLDRKWA